MTTPRVVHEVERSYAADSALPLPPLDGLPGVAAPAPARTARLDATYVDTADLRLAARGVRLRRRTGGADAGWHLKAPSTTGTTEVQLPPGRSLRTVPAELRDLVLALTRGAPLMPVARLRTRRTEVDLLDAEGAVVAIVADDDVSGQLLDADGAGAELDRWRELEVELVGDTDLRLLDAVEERLVAAGAVPATHPSKVARVLGARSPTVLPGPPGRLRRRSPAGDVVMAYVRDQVDAIVSQDARVRRDAAGSVHKMRVGTRRLRSTLRTFRPLLDADVTEPLRAELRWLAGVLGGMRDQEVLHARLRAALDGLPTALVLGPVLARVESTLAHDAAAAREAALRELRGRRYLALLDDLDALFSRPPLAAAAAAPAGDALPPLVRATHRKVREALATADAVDVTSPDVRHVRDEALHEARKLAKRLRYAGEALAPAFGRPAERLATRAEDLQELLGEHQDAIVATGVLRRMGVAAHGAAENGFSYGVLVGLERARADAAEALIPRAWKRLDAGKVRTLS